MNLILEGWSTVKYLLSSFSCRRLKLTHLSAYFYSGIFIFLIDLIWVTLTCTTRQVSNAQLNKSSSAHCKIKNRKEIGRNLCLLHQKHFLSINVCGKWEICVCKKNIILFKEIRNCPWKIQLNFYNSHLNPNSWVEAESRKSPAGFHRFPEPALSGLRWSCWMVQGTKSPLWRKINMNQFLVWEIMLTMQSILPRVMATYQLGDVALTF